MQDVRTLLAGNAVWARSVIDSNPSFLPSLTRQQSPMCLWIGCSDSRVPPDTVVGAPPGTIFVHRNIANLAPPTDPSLLAVLQFAVETLRVPHIVVCGHTNCGGLTAVAQGETPGDVGRWLLPARALYDRNRTALEAIGSLRERVNHFAVLNVKAQVEALSRITHLVSAWHAGHELAVHGFMYELATGCLRDLGVSVNAPPPAPPNLAASAKDSSRASRPKDLW